MFSSRTDHQVQGYLGRALSLELSAVQLYATQARLVETWGLIGPAEKLRAESREELGHADRIIARMLELQERELPALLAGTGLPADILQPGDETTISGDQQVTILEHGPARPRHELDPALGHLARHRLAAEELPA